MVLLEKNNWVKEITQHTVHTARTGLFKRVIPVNAGEVYRKSCEEVLQNLGDYEGNDAE